MPSSPPMAQMMTVMIKSQHQSQPPHQSSQQQLSQPQPLSQPQLPQLSQRPQRTCEAYFCSPIHPIELFSISFHDHEHSGPHHGPDLFQTIFTNAFPVSQRSQLFQKPAHQSSHLASLRPVLSQPKVLHLLFQLLVDTLPVDMLTVIDSRYLL